MLTAQKKLNIVFMGTPGFAVPSLEILINNHYNVVGVVTVADKPAGRGYKLKESEVKTSAKKHGVEIMQPTDLKSPEFIQRLKDLGTNLIVVVAFRKMPKEVWGLPEFGTFNLHGSLLPNYRGAAPLNWAIINGEKQTGVTTFFLDEKIDTGAIIDSKKIDIGENDTVGDIHDLLMELGANLVLETVQKIEKAEVKAIDQADIVGDSIKKAPKIFKFDCEINWNKPSKEVHDLIRGLSPYPTAFSSLHFPNGKKIKVKLFETSLRDSLTNHAGEEGQLVTDQKSFLRIHCKVGTIEVHSIQPEGKRRMKTSEFLRGKKLEGCHFE